MSNEQWKNAIENGDAEIPSFQGSEKAKASDFANYFCSYAQLYHQKQMLADHNRMAAYHSAIMGNCNVFKDKVCFIITFSHFILVKVLLSNNLLFYVLSFPVLDSSLGI
jgi:hypothetical protein